MAPIITRAPSEKKVAHSPSPDKFISLGEYLFLRICQTNPKIRSVFGIPGDFSLPLLEHLYADAVVAKLEFVGFCNELNAAYAADGYARRIGGLSVLITTFGVGELSALNGIAGAFAEYAPVLHIVGTTPTDQAEQAHSSNILDVRNIHHLVQNRNALLPPDHNVYKPIVEKLSVIQESLDTEVFLNMARIDRVLATVTRERRPGYLFIPSNISDMLVPHSRLELPLKLSELNDEELLTEISLKILNRLYESHRPSILGDALADRFGGQKALDAFVKALPSNFVKLFTTLMARNIDETLPNFVGVYGGKLSSDPAVADSLENESDFLLSLGYANNEINSGAYSTDLSQIREYIEVHPDYVLMGGVYTYIKDPATGLRLFSIVSLLSRLAQDFKITKLKHNNCGVNNIKMRREKTEFGLSENAPAELITQRRLVDFFNVYLQPGDVVVCETGSFLFATWDLRLPRGVTIIAQNFYESIGYALPATFGVSRAERDTGGQNRIILIQGDGAAQMTVQEWSTYLRYKIQNPVIFLLNNRGYTVERMIKGATRPYNDIQDTWRWTQLFKVFGDEHCEKHESSKINTTDELKNLPVCKSSEKIIFYELALGKLDIVEKFQALRE